MLGESRLYGTQPGCPNCVQPGALIQVIVCSGLLFRPFCSTKERQGRSGLGRCSMASIHGLLPSPHYRVSCWRIMLWQPSNQKAELCWCLGVFQVHSAKKAGWFNEPLQFSENKFWISSFRSGMFLSNIVPRGPGFLPPQPHPFINCQAPSKRNPTLWRKSN